MIHFLHSYINRCCTYITFLKLKNILINYVNVSLFIIRIFISIQLLLIVNYLITINAQRYQHLFL